VTPWVPVEFVEEISDLCPDLSTVVQACCVYELWHARRGDQRGISIQSGPDTSAQSVARVARLNRNVRQPNHVLAN